MDSLKNNVRVVAFVNEDLKDNHQVELVQAMVEEKYLNGFLSFAEFSVTKVS